MTDEKRERNAGEVDPKDDIPDRVYYRIGEVSNITGLKSYVLRYWETEFPQLKVKKSPTGQRLYRKEDIELVFKIKKLLYDERLTIAGARKKLRHEMREGGIQLPLRLKGDSKVALKKIRTEVVDLMRIIEAG